MLRLILFDLREYLGGALLRWALRALPEESSALEGTRRGLREQREYDYYEGYARLLRQAPVPFLQWREQRATMKAHALPRLVHDLRDFRDKSGPYVVREHCA